MFTGGGVVSGGAHVDLGAEPQRGGATEPVEIEHHSLSLPQHAEDGAGEGIGRQVNFGEVGIAQQRTLTGGRVVGLDHSLHGIRRYRPLLMVDEFALIDRIAEMVPGVAGGDVGIGDDCAVVATAGGGRLLLAADVAVEGVHFDRRWSTPADAGWRAVATNVSDVAAMGGRPLHLLVSLVVGPGFDPEECMGGVARAARAWDVVVAGGDLSSGPATVISIAVTGTTDGRNPVLRSGAAAGDTVLVTGPVGRAAADLRLLEGGVAIDDVFDRARSHRRPLAPVREGLAAANAGATAMIDVSDGLLADLGHVASASGLGFEIDAVPVAEGATVAEAVAGGDDYVLLICHPDPVTVVGAFAADHLDEPVVIGRLVDDAQARTLLGEQLPWLPGWRHELGVEDG